MQSLFKINNKVLERHAQGISIPIDTYKTYIEETSSLLTEILLKTSCPVEQIPSYLESIYQTAISNLSLNSQEPIYNSYCRIGKVLKTGQARKNIQRCIEQYNVSELIFLLTSQIFIDILKEYNFSDFPSLNYEYLFTFCYISEVKRKFNCNTNFQLVDIILLSSYTPFLKHLDLLHTILPDMYFYAFLYVFDTINFSDFITNHIGNLSTIDSLYDIEHLSSDDYIDILTLLLHFNIPSDIRQHIKSFVTSTVGQSDGVLSIGDEYFNQSFLTLGEITKDIVNLSLHKTEELSLVQGF